MYGSVSAGLGKCLFCVTFLRRLVWLNQKILTTSDDLCWPIATSGCWISKTSSFQQNHFLLHRQHDPFFKFYYYITLSCDQELDFDGFHDFFTSLIVLLEVEWAPLKIYKTYLLTFEKSPMWCSAAGSQYNNYIKQKFSLSCRNWPIWVSSGEK